LQYFSEQAGVVGIKMLHQHEGHAAISGGVAEELFQSFQTSGGSPNADDGDSSSCFFRYHGGGLC
jgi:hypothetical protein